MIALPPLAQGTSFAGEYRIVELLSHTSHLALYGAAHVPSGEMRVLELVFAPIVPGAAFRDRFARAAMEPNRAAGAFVPRVEAAGVDNTAQVPFVVTEPFRGEMLAAAATRSGGMPVADAMDVLGQVATGLGQLHAAGVVHGGLRPESVVLIAGPTPRPAVKILNAGLAKVLGDARVASAPSAAPCDPSWAAPEQIEGGEATAASDVYTFALLAFTVFTGHRIWRGTAEAAVVREATKDALPIPTMRAYELGRGGTLPTTFDGWFARAAARNPAERHASVQDAFVDLQAALHRAAMAYTGSISGMISMTSANIVPPPPRASSGRGALIAAGVFGGILLLGGLGYGGYQVAGRAFERYKERSIEAARLADERVAAVETKTSAAEVAPAAVDAKPGESGDKAAADPNAVPSIDVGALPTAGGAHHHHHDDAKPLAAEPPPTPAPAPKADAKPESSAPSSPASLVESKPSSGSSAGATRLQVIDLSSGKGKAAKSGDKITVRYTAKRQADGVTYDTSHSVAPFSFTLGAGRVTKGWEQGIPGMKVGGKRRLVVPPQLAYGEKGLGSAVPPNATLIFDLELVSID